MEEYSIFFKNEDILALCYQNLRALKGLTLSRRQGSIWCRGEEGLAAVLTVALSCFILGPWEEKRLYTLVLKLYPDFNTGQQHYVVKKARIILLNRGGGLFCGFNRCRKLAAELNFCLSKSRVLNMDGFMAFRLLGYGEYLQSALKQGAEDIWLNREEEQFWALCRNCLNRIKSGKSHHLLLFKASYTLLEEGEELTIVEGGAALGKEAMLISRLIFLAPERLIMHREEGVDNKLLSQSLKRIFKDRYRPCPGCKICSVT